MITIDLKSNCDFTHVVVPCTCLSCPHGLGGLSSFLRSFYFLSSGGSLISAKSEMKYCASAASMLAEEIWEIAEGFVEVPVNLLA